MKKIDYIKRTYDEIYSNLILSQFKFKTYIPVTSMSISFYVIVYLLNEIEINKRSSIIEFGCGLSTIYMSKLIKTNKLNCKIVSVDEDENWLRYISDILYREDLHDCVELIYAPIDYINTNNRWYKWYSHNILNKYCFDKKFDMVLVDAPNSYINEPMIRFGAVPYIYDKLYYDFVIFLDNADRQEELEIINLWEKIYDLKFVIQNEIAVYYSKNRLLSIPTKYYKLKGELI